MPKAATSIQLSEEQIQHLTSIIQKGTIEVRVYKRAKILLLKSQGISNEAIADKLDITIPTVRLCLQKFLETGIQAALEDAAGRGRKAEIFDDAKAWVVNIACQKPTAFSLSAELWYPASLTRFVNSVAEAEGYPRMATASVSSIIKILRKAQLNPHKMSRQMLHGIRVPSKDALKERIYKYFDEVNAVPVPYKWKHKMDTIRPEDEDVSEIVYEVVNAKAAGLQNQGKRAPIPTKRKGTKKNQDVCSKS